MDLWCGSRELDMCVHVYMHFTVEIWGVGIRVYGCELTIGMYIGAWTYFMCMYLYVFCAWTTHLLLPAKWRWSDISWPVTQDSYFIITHFRVLETYSLVIFYVQCMVDPKPGSKRKITSRYIEVLSTWGGGESVKGRSEVTHPSICKRVQSFKPWVRNFLVVVVVGLGFVQ